MDMEKEHVLQIIINAKNEWLQSISHYATDPKKWDTWKVFDNIFTKINKYFK